MTRKSKPKKLGFKKTAIRKLPETDLDVAKGGGPGDCNNNSPVRRTAGVSGAPNR